MLCFYISFLDEMTLSVQTTDKPDSDNPTSTKPVNKRKTLPKQAGEYFCS